jgi:hypothetical protein
LISFSAINTWVGEELRTIGAEYSLEWLGTRSGHAFDAEFVAGIYGWNDPAGVLLHRAAGPCMTARQPCLARSANPATCPVPGRVLFKEIDGRPGYYAGLHLRYLDRAELRYMHYDNRADPEAFDAGINDFAWLTCFDSIGLRVETANGWTFISQWLSGETSIEPESGYEEWKYSSTFALVSKAIGQHRFSLRADWFDADHFPDELPAGRHGIRICLDRRLLIRT